MISGAEQRCCIIRQVKTLMKGLLIFSMLLGCGGGGSGGSNDGGNTPGSEPSVGSLALSGKVDVDSKNIPVTGGEVTVNNEESPLNGLIIKVPSGAYSSATDFNISYREITGHDASPHFNPVTPLITVENGGSTAAEIMKVTIPADIPEGHFAMAFYYDETSGQFSGLPLIAQGETGVTVATRHFSDLVVSSIDEDALIGQLPITSGFLPGRDDWQFANRGSFIAPGGHCAGQSVAAVWYYMEKRLSGAPTLYGAYDNNGNTKTTSIWQDDSNAYRFCSVIQRDIDWETLGEKTDEIFQEVDNESQEFNQNQVWKAFAYAILITEAPQFLGMYTDYDINDKRGGHAMVIYGVQETEDAYQLQVADPNYPGETRAISFDIYGNPSPYSSAATAEDAANGYGSWYTEFYYYGKDAVIPWGQIDSRWAQVEDGTIGNGLFPECRIYASILETSGWEDVQIENGVLDTTDPAPEIYIRIPEEDGSFSSSDQLVFFALDNPTSQYVGFGNQYTAELEEGENLYGINATVKRTSGNYEHYSYLDFQWITINYTPQPAYQVNGDQIEDYIELGDYTPSPYQYNATINTPNLANIEDDVMLGTEYVSFEVTVSKLPFSISIDQDVSGMWSSYNYATPNGDQHYWTQTSETYWADITKSDGETKQRYSNSTGDFSIGIDDSRLQTITDGYYQFDALFGMDYRYSIDTYGDEEYEYHGSSQRKGLWLLFLTVYVTLL